MEKDYQLIHLIHYLLEINVYYHSNYHTHLQQQKEEDCLQIVERFPVNNMNKCNRMTIMMTMMKIFFDAGDGEKIFIRIEMCMILVCLFINIRYLQLLSSFMPSSFISWTFLVLFDTSMKVIS